MSPSDQVRSEVAKYFSQAKVHLLPETLILRILKLTNNSVQETCNIICKFIQAKRDYDKFFTVRPDDESFILSVGIHIITLKQRGPQGEIILIHDASLWEPKTVSCKYSFALDVFVTYALSLTPEAMTNGIILLFNGKFIAWKHIKAFDVFSSIPYAKVLLNSLPVNVKNFIVHNTTWALEKVDSITRPLLPKNIAGKVVIASETKFKSIMQPVDVETVQRATENDCLQFKQLMKQLARQVVSEWQAIDAMFQ